MNNRPNSDKRLEHLVSRMLRELPRRRAPATLEQRVLDELRRRQRRVGWRQGFSRWPAPTRACFVIVSVVVMASLLAAMTAAGDLATLLVAIIPTAWLYIILSVGSLLYAALFGLSAVAYRTLYLQPSNHR